jgi:hypothetical protein
LEQQAAGRAYIAGWFEMVLGRDTRLLPLFDGSGARAASAGRAVVDTTAQIPSAARRDLARFEDGEPAVSVAGGATARRCAGDESVLTPAPTSTLPVCAAIDDTSRVPHWSPAFLALGAPMPAVTRVRWSRPKGVVHVAIAAGRRDLRGFDALSLRMAPDPATSGRVDLSIALVDGKGRRATVPVSSVSNALDRLDGDDFGLPKTILRSVRIPLGTVHGISLADVRRVDLVADRTATGSVYVSDLAVSRRAIGRSGPSSLPRLSIADVRIKEGNGSLQVMRFRVHLSRRANRTVRVHVDAGTGEFFGVRNVSKGSKALVFRPGETTKTLALSEHGDTVFGQGVTFPVVLSVPRDAIVERNVATGTIVEDDPAPKLRIGSADAVESDGVLRFPMRIDADTADGVVVLGTVIDGTATVGDDIADTRFVAGFIDPGSRRGSIDVPLVDDDIAEGTETFAVEIDDVFGARLLPPTTVTGTIHDDD